jgi:hypothetical protein
MRPFLPLVLKPLRKCDMKSKKSRYLHLSTLQLMRALTAYGDWKQLLSLFSRWGPWSLSHEVTWY